MTIVNYDTPSYCFVYLFGLFIYSDISLIIGGFSIFFANIGT